MLAALKKLLSKDETPEVVKLYGKAKTEREALLLLKEARKRDHARRGEVNAKLSALTNEESVLMNEGRQEDTTDSRRQFLARRVKEIRDEAQLLRQKVDKIYGPRLKTLDHHIQSLETVIEVESEPIPTLTSMEETAVRAKTLMSGLDDAVELAQGISQPFMGHEADDEEKGILGEMSELREKDREKAKKEKAAKEKPKEKVKKAEAQRFKESDFEDLEEA